METIYLNLSVSQNKALNADAVTALRSLTLVQGESYQVNLAFYNGTTATTPTIADFTFHLRSSAGVNLLNENSISSQAGNYPYYFTFTADNAAVSAALGTSAYVDFSGVISFDSGTEITVISPFTIRVMTTAGTSGDYVSSVNGINGAALITGAGNVTVSNAGQTVTISGANQDLSPYALTSSLNATGNALNASISALQGQTGTYYPRTNPSGYQTAANVSSSLSSYYPLSNPSGYLNSASGVVMTTGNQTISGNKRFNGLITGTLGSIAVWAAKMTDSSSKHSIDWYNRNLLDSNQGNSVDWWYRKLHANDNDITLDWGDRKLYGSSSSIYSTLDWENGQLFDTAGNTAIDWNNRELKDNYGGSSLDFGEQATTSIYPASYVQNGTNAIYDGDTFDGYTIAQVVAALRMYKILA